jgi:hypothetical protein
VDGHSIAGDHKRLFIRVLNGDASPITVTLKIPKTLDGQAVVSGGRDVTVIATTGDVLMGPFTQDYLQSDGTIHVDFSAVTSVTCAAFSL